MWRYLAFATLLLTATPTGAAGPEISSLNDPLIDQRGQTTTLQDIIGTGEPVVVSFTYTGCNTICPISDVTMAALDQEHGKFRLVTITIDPLTDTPDVMARAAKEHAAGPRWSWLSGEPENVYRVAERLGMQFGSLEDHPSFFLVFRRAGMEILRLDSRSKTSDLLSAVTTGSQ